jgi:streptogramin lyase
MFLPGFRGRRQAEASSRSQRTTGKTVLRLESLEDRTVPSVSIQEFTIPTIASNPSGIAFGPDGNVWFLEQGGNNVGHLTPTGQFGEVALPTNNAQPFAIADGPDGALWFTEQAAQSVARVKLDGTITEFPTDTDDPNAQPSGITLGSDGNMWFTEQAAGEISQIITSGANLGQINEFQLPHGASSMPVNITLGPDGNMWFTEQGIDKIGRITAKGVVTEFSLPTDAFSPKPFGITTGPDGALWVTLPGTNKIARVTTSGLVHEFTLPTPGANPQGITVATDGNLWFTETTASQIGTITTNGVITEVATPTPNSFPSFIAPGPDGNLYFTEANSSQIGKILMPHIVAVGPDETGGPDVRVINPVTGGIVKEILAYDGRFQGGVRVALGDVNHDGIPDIVTAPGPGGGPDIRVFDGVTGRLIDEFMAYDQRFTGGVFVAVGDVNGDGFADIITGTDSGGGPEVKVFDGSKLKQLNAKSEPPTLLDFMAYSKFFPGGVRVATANVDGDGLADIITGAGPGGGPHVKIFDGQSGALLQSYYAFSANFSGGIYVAAGDVTGDGIADIIVGQGQGGGEVKVFDGTNSGVFRDFFPYGSSMTSGVRVAAWDFNGDNHVEIVTASGQETPPLIKVFDGSTNGLLDQFFAFNSQFLGGVFIGAH